MIDVNSTNNCATNGAYTNSSDSRFKKDIMMKAIQEQQEIIKDQQKQIDELKHELEVIKAMIGSGQ
jgi:predicted house-cleaning noncanonical NTP pyrophosphatase (MazG superfamily)